MGNSTDDKGRNDGETKIRGKDLAGSERSNAADHSRYEQKVGADKVIRTDDEKDTLYEDGIELDDESSPLTGINGRDDTRKA